jgi:hypothetical protein
LESDAPTGQQPARYPFVARVKVRGVDSKVQFDGITSDLSEGGCCVLTSAPFSRGMRVLLEITKGDVSLVTYAVVAYNLKGQAIGLSFEGMPSEQSHILPGWIKAATALIRRNPTRML